MKPRRGFDTMDPEKQRLIAMQGGKAAHAKGRAHEWTSEEGRAAAAKRKKTALVRALREMKVVSEREGS